MPESIEHNASIIGRTLVQCYRFLLLKIKNSQRKILVQWVISTDLVSNLHDVEGIAVCKMLAMSLIL